MKAPVVIKLNGVQITDQIDGIDSFQVTYRESDEEGVLLKSYSSELTFYGQGYNILKTALIDNPNGFINEINAEVYDECCGNLVFDGVIKGDSIDWCEPECWVSCEIVEKKPEITCVKSTLIADNHDDFLDRPQKQLRYCVEMRPQFVTEILLLFYAIINVAIISTLLPFALAVFAWQGVIYLICSIVCAIPGTSCTQTTCDLSPVINPEVAIQTIAIWFDDLTDRMVQCQWYHPTALVRDYIENACKKCGLTFQSSILNDPASPYYNLLLFSAPVRKGYKPSGTENKLIVDNIPIETLETLMTRHLNLLFNAKYWIKNGVFIFERRDYFENGNTWVDSESLLLNNKVLDNRICISWINKEKYAYGVYKYLEDGSDLLGYEAAERYNTVVEWNNPPSPMQSGFMENQFLSGVARFRDDEAGWEATNFNGAINALLSNALNNSKNLLLMSQHTSFNYKFLIWDDSSPLTQSLVARSYDSSFTGGSVIGDNYSNFFIFEQVDEDVPLNPNKLFNYPMWFNENNTNNLYTLFHYINNPRHSSTKLYDFSFTFEFDCGEFNAIDFTKNIRLKIGNQIKFGEIKELTVDFVKRTIAVRGIV